MAEAFRTTWDQVFCSVERAVVWGREHQDLSGVQAIGVDEIAWQREHRYLTLVYQIDGHGNRYCVALRLYQYRVMTVPEMLLSRSAAIKRFFGMVYTTASVEKDNSTIRPSRSRCP